MQISERVRTMKPSLTLSVNTRAMELRAQGIQVTSLAVGEPDFPTPKHICEAAKAAIDANFCRYTAVPGIPELRAAVGGYFKKFYGEDIAPECTIVSAGGKHALYNFMQASINPGDEVLLPAPYWVSYPYTIQLAGGVPVLFFNRAIEADGEEGTVLNANSNICFIGTDAPEAGHLQGKMIGEYLLKHFDECDLNGDGKISYAMFKGDEANVEAIYRTQFGVEDADAVLTAAGKPALEYFDASNASKYQVDLGGAWSAQAALDYMNTNLSQYNEANGNMIELIICNNDNMAEGAISALEAAGYNTGAEGATTIPVFGVDATDAAKELIAAGKMTGTVKQDAEGMAVAIADVVKATGEGTAMADAVAATAGTNAEMYSIADGIANKLFVAYAAYTK